MTRNSQCAVVVILLSRHRLGLGKYLTLGYKKESAATATIIQQWRASSTLSSTSTNTPHIFNASLLPAPLPSHHPLLNFSTMFCKKCDFEQFCISDGFSHFSPSVPSSCSEPCQLPIAKPTCRFSDLWQVYLLQSEALNIYSHLYLRVLSPPDPALLSI